jgi:ferric-dicitrate binding protein FerR (iron transport regulator)
MSNKKQYREIVRRYLENKASDDELDVFFHLLRAGKVQRYLREALEQGERSLMEEETGEKDDAPAVVRPIVRWKSVAEAAVLAGLLAGAAAWYFGHAHSVRPAAHAIAASADIQPGRNHALLTLPGGKTLDLDSNSNTVLALQANTSLVRNKAGEWEYHAPSAPTADIMYNTLSAPRGGQFPFVLEDGTHVWLNAASSLRFPTAFQGDKREVYLEGEAYFEVAPDAHRTFLVKTGGEEIQVLGTDFNVNAYTDEPAIRTTLVSGSVKIIREQASALLKPGEIASIGEDGKVTRISDEAAADASVAWRNGYFSFEEDPIQTVMRQISRWYDVEIRYDGPVTKALFGGDIGRDLTLMQVLKVLEKSQVHFRLDGKVLTVLP